MKININSWHCKLIEEYNIPSSEFCNYFWQLVYAIIRKTYLWAVVLVFMFIHGSFVLYNDMFLDIDLIAVSPFPMNLISVFSTFIAMVGYLLIFLLIISLSYKVPKMNIVSKIGDFFSLFWTYIVSVKKKICPRIEFVKK